VPCCTLHIIVHVLFIFYFVLFFVLVLVLVLFFVLVLVLQESWGGLLEHIRVKMFDEWMPNLRLEPVVSVKSWEPQAPRCTVCSVGFVRVASTIEAFQSNPVAYLQTHQHATASTAGGTTASVNGTGTGTGTAEGGGGGGVGGGAATTSLEHKHLCLGCSVRKELFYAAKPHFVVNQNGGAGGATTGGGNGGGDDDLVWPFAQRKKVVAQIRRRRKRGSSGEDEDVFGPTPPPSAPLGSAGAGAVQRAGLQINSSLGGVGGVGGGYDWSFAAGSPHPLGMLGMIGEEGEGSLMGSSGFGGGGGDSVSAMSGTSSLSGLGGPYSPQQYHQLQPFQQQQQRAMSPDLALLMPPVSLQTAQSHSPVKSLRLQELDAQEVWEKLHHHPQRQQQFAAAGADADDSSSIQSTASAFSGVTDSVNNNHVGSDGMTRSLASTVTEVNPLKKPKELALLPFLIAKGHFEEAERTLRIALGKAAVDEGEGLKLLVSLLTLQAEMYKSMGLWPLALATYFDCVDLTASLMGFNDSATLGAIALLVSCMRKMQCVHLAGKYIKSLCTMVEQQTLKAVRLEIVDKIKKVDRYEEYWPLAIPPLDRCTVVFLFIIFIFKLYLHIFITTNSIAVPT
jgi:hypothetical protein